jgi:large subunit ribosomal protein L25
MSPNETKLQAESRNEFGKGAARRIRRADKVPAVLYGHGTDPVHITLPGHDTMMALKHGGANALLSIELDGESQLALPKQVQKDPLKGFLEHLDLIIVRRGEKVTVDVPVTTVGEVVTGAVLDQPMNSISVLTEATHIPTGFEIDIEKKEEGFQLFARDIELPKGVELAGDPDQLVLHVTVTRAEVAEEAAEEEAAEGEAAEGAEGEAPAEAAAE